MLHARGALRLAVRRRDPLVGAMMWAHDAQVHMLVLPAQTANSEDRVLTSCGTRDWEHIGMSRVWAPAPTVATAGPVCAGTSSHDAPEVTLSGASWPFGAQNGSSVSRRRCRWSWRVIGRRGGSRRRVLLGADAPVKQ